MNFELDVNPNAEIGIVIDKETGSYLSGRGAGNILMKLIQRENLICGVIL